MRMFMVSVRSPAILALGVGVLMRPGFDASLPGTSIPVLDWGYSTGPGGGNSIQMLTRSMLVIMFELATQIDVPAEDEEK